MSKLYYKSALKNEFSEPLLRDKKGISHTEGDLHLVSLPGLPGTMGGSTAIFLAGKPVLVIILLGVKIVNWKHKMGKGKGQKLQDSKEVGLGVGSVVQG